MTDDPLPIPDACKKLWISRSTLYLEHAEGRIRFTKIRNRSFVMTSEIERYLRTLNGKRGKAA